VHDCTHHFINKGCTPTTQVGTRITRDSWEWFYLTEGYFLSLYAALDALDAHDIRSVILTYVIPIVTCVLMWYRLSPPLECDLMTHLIELVPRLESLLADNLNSMSIYERVDTCILNTECSDVVRPIWPRVQSYSRAHTSLCLAGHPMHSNPPKAFLVVYIIRSEWPWLWFEFDVNDVCSHVGLIHNWALDECYELCCTTGRRHTLLHS